MTKLAVRKTLCGCYSQLLEVPAEQMEIKVGVGTGSRLFRFSGEVRSDGAAVFDEVEGK